MPRLLHAFALATIGGAIATPAAAQDLVLDAEVPADAPPYFEVPFTVPEGTVEIEVRHDDGSDANILDWGLRDPERFRGWGGGNAEPAVVGAEAASRSYLAGPMPEGEWAVLVGRALVAEPPARYHVEIFFRTAATLPVDPDRGAYAPAAPLASGPRWLAGDLHVHSRESGDARPTIDEVADFAASRGLDFVELSEHNAISQLDFLTSAQARHPDVLLLPGIEVTTYFGHANAIGATAWVDFRVESGIGVDVGTVLDATEAAGAVFSINHPVLDLGNQCLGCAWDLDAPPDRVRAVEIQNGAWSVTGSLFYPRAIRFWERLLATGAHVAVVGGSDDHDAGESTGMFASPIGGPTTMVFADELSAAAIVEAIDAGRTVVKLEGPDDPMVELEAGRGADLARVGATVEGPVELRGRVTGGGIGGTLTFYRNGAPAEAFTVDADPFEVTLAVEPPPGDVDDRFRLELVDGVPRVVTSHIWVRATGEPIPEDAGAGTDAGVGTPTGGGCSCRAGRRDGGPAWPLFVGLALLIASRRR